VRGIHNKYSKLRVRELGVRPARAPRALAMAKGSNTVASAPRALLQAPLRC
jgi:hypothetical protein